MFVLYRCQGNYQGSIHDVHDFVSEDRWGENSDFVGVRTSEKWGA